MVCKNKTRTLCNTTIRYSTHIRHLKTNNNGIVILPRFGMERNATRKKQQLFCKQPNYVRTRLYNRVYCRQPKKIFQ